VLTSATLVLHLNPTSTSLLCSTLAAVNLVVVLDCLAKFYVLALCLICHVILKKLATVNFVVVLGGLAKIYVLV
jgi:hypothetical protein